MYSHRRLCDAQQYQRNEGRPPRCEDHWQEQLYWLQRIVGAFGAKPCERIYRQLYHVERCGIANHCGHSPEQGLCIVRRNRICRQNLYHHLCCGRECEVETRKEVQQM